MKSRSPISTRHVVMALALPLVLGLVTLMKRRAVSTSEAARGGSPERTEESDGVAAAANSGSRRSPGSIGSARSIGSIGSYCCIGSIGSSLSIGSIGSSCSIGSIGSFASIASIASAGSFASFAGLFSCCSTFSAGKKTP
jgi:hypothetical protein